MTVQQTRTRMAMMVTATNPNATPSIKPTIVTGTTKEATGRNKFQLEQQWHVI